jgi:DnaJ-class molecular chaperone
MLVPEYKMVECEECCGEGYDLDTLYWGDEYCDAGTEVDCSTCGGDGQVPQEIEQKEVDTVAH